MGTGAKVGIGTTIGLIVGFVLGVVAAGDLDSDDTTAALPQEERAEAAEEPEPEPEPEPLVPDPDDIDIDLRILERRCFGSAGCSITFRIVPSYVGSADLPDDVTYTVIYEVRGGEDGPQINTFSITGNEALFDSEERISTPPNPRLRAKATEVFIE